MPKQKKETKKKTETRGPREPELGGYGGHGTAALGSDVLTLRQNMVQLGWDGNTVRGAAIDVSN